MINVDKMAADFAAEATSDHVGLWQIAKRVEYHLDPIDELTYRAGTHDQREIRHYGMEVVSRLMVAGLRACDYCTPDPTLTGIRFWTGTPEDQMKRIETEWTALGRNPDHLEPICWFALPTGQTASHTTEIAERLTR